MFFLSLFLIVGKTYFLIKCSIYLFSILWYPTLTPDGLFVNIYDCKSTHVDKNLSKHKKTSVHMSTFVDGL